MAHMKTVMSQDTMHVQEPGSLVHKKWLKLLQPLALPSKAVESHALVNHAKGLELLKP